MVAPLRLTPHASCLRTRSHTNIPFLLINRQRAHPRTPPATRKHDLRQLHEAPPSLPVRATCTDPATRAPAEGTTMPAPKFDMSQPQTPFVRTRNFSKKYPIGKTQSGSSHWSVIGGPLSGEKKNRFATSQEGCTCKWHLERFARLDIFTAMVTIVLVARSHRLSGDVNCAWTERHESCC